MQSETIGKLAEALSKAQGQMDNAKKDSINPHFKAKFADLASVIDAIKEPLSKNGLSYVQYFEEDNFVVTKLMHASGEWICGKLKLIINKQDMQGLGSAITYARRFSLTSMMGIFQDDDDGNSAVKGTNGHKHLQEKPKLDDTVSNKSDDTLPNNVLDMDNSKRQWKFDRSKHLQPIVKFTDQLQNKGMTKNDIMTLSGMNKPLDDFSEEEYLNFLGILGKKVNER